MRQMCNVCTYIYIDQGCDIFLAFSLGLVSEANLGLAVSYFCHPHQFRRWKAFLQGKSTDGIIFLPEISDKIEVTIAFPVVCSKVMLIVEPHWYKAVMGAKIWGLL